MPPPDAEVVIHSTPFGGLLGSITGWKVSTPIARSGAKSTWGKVGWVEGQMGGEGFVPEPPYIIISEIEGASEAHIR